MTCVHFPVKRLHYQAHETSHGLYFAFRLCLLFIHANQLPN